MKQNTSRNFQSNNEALYPCLSVKKILHAGIIGFYLLSCLSIEVYASSTAGTTKTPAQGNAYENVGQKVVTPARPASISAAKEIQSRQIEATANDQRRLFTLPAAPAVTVKQNIPANISVAREIQARQIEATANDQRRLPTLPASLAATAPLKVPTLAATPAATAPLKVPTLAATPKPITPIQSLPNNSFTRTSTNYNMPLSVARIPNLNSAFKPAKIETPSEIALTSLKYKNIPMTNLQIKPLPAMKPIVNPTLKTLQAQSFNKLTMPKMTPINNAMVKPIAAIKPLPMQKPIVSALKPLQAHNLVNSAMLKMTPINNTMVEPIAAIRPLPMQKPIQTQSFVRYAIPAITPINNTIFKPIATIKPLPMAKPMVSVLKPIQTQSFVKHTIPVITPINKAMFKPIESIKPLTLQKPIATNIKSMPAPKFANIDVPSLNYMGKTFNFEVPAQLNRLTTPSITPIKMTPIRLSEMEIPKYSMPNIITTPVKHYPVNRQVMEIPKYAMPNITVTQVKYYPINRQVVEKTIKTYDAKVMHDAGRINSMIAPSNNLQKYFNTRHELRIDLTKFIQNAPSQRKEIINQAQIYTNGSEMKKLKALDVWRNEYDKFLALSSNISNVVKETGQVDAYSLDRLENVKENLDTLTRNITDMGVDKAAIQQVIQGPSEPVINPLMKEKIPMPSALENPSLRVLPRNDIAPKINILGGLANGVSNLFSPAVHAEEQ